MTNEEAVRGILLLSVAAAAGMNIRKVPTEAVTYCLKGIAQLATALKAQKERKS